jgi:hypothetical protein
VIRSDRFIFHWTEKLDSLESENEVRVALLGTGQKTSGVRKVRNLSAAIKWTHSWR